MIQNFIILLLTLLLLLSCEQEKSIISSHKDSYPNEMIGKINFNSYVKMRCAFGDSTKAPFAVSIKNINQQSNFVDTMKYLYKSASFYQDSMLIGAFYNQDISASCEFAIDSVIADSNALNIFASIIIPTGQLDIISHPCHFISVKKSDKHVVFFKLTTIIVPAFGVKITPDSLILKYQHCIITQISAHKLVVFRNGQDEQMYLDTAFIKPWSTPSNFNYTDTMIVGTITFCKYSSSETFKVVDVRKVEDKILIEGHIFSPVWVNPDIGSWHHWLAIKKDSSEMELTIKQFSNLY